MSATTRLATIKNKGKQMLQKPKGGRREKTTAEDLQSILGAIPKFKYDTKAKLGAPYYSINESGVSVTVLRSANSWWVDGGKVALLVMAFRADASIEEACNYAGITVDQYKYFVQLHPDFSTLKRAIANNPTFAARIKVVSHISRDLETAKWYLSKKRKKEFGDKIQLEHSFNNLPDIDEDADPALSEALDQAREAMAQGESEFIEAEFVEVKANE